MSYYRLYFMDPRTGHIMRFAEFEAADDESALALAREHDGSHASELWNEGRKVARIECAGPSGVFVWQPTNGEYGQSSNTGA